MPDKPKRYVAREDDSVRIKSHILIHGGRWGIIAEVLGCGGLMIDLAGERLWTYFDRREVEIIRG